MRKEEVRRIHDGLGYVVGWIFGCECVLEILYNYAQFVRSVCNDSIVCEVLMYLRSC